MAVLRNLLLWGSQNAWLEHQFRRRRFARIAVSRFMPGEDVADALSAAGELGTAGIRTIFTRLGENVTSSDGVDDVVGHYLDVYDQIAAGHLDTHISIKLTQLGLDIDAAAAFDNLMTLLERAGARGNFLWMDMEQSQYVDATLDLYRRARARHANIGVCLQSYLRRTRADLEGLLAIDGTVRLVKGAYHEPAAIAFEHKADVDASYLELAQRCLDHAARSGGPGPHLHAIATHDLPLIGRINAYADAIGLDHAAYEVNMLYGIRAAEQRKIAAAGRPIRVLISYGDSWFPWYMRRLAERPANVGFVVRSMFMR